MPRLYTPWRKWLGLLSRSISYGHRATHRMKKPERRYRRLNLERLEDRTVLSAFYNLTTLATTAIPGAFAGQSFGNLPSINNQGRVAFVTNGPSGNGIYLAGQGQTINVTPTFTAGNNARTYGRGVAINDTNTIVAMDHLGTGYYVRRWDGNNPDQKLDLFLTPYPLSPDNNFTSAQTFTSINNDGDIAFVASDQVGATRVVEKFDSTDVVQGDETPVAIEDANGAKVSPRPVLTDDGSVLFVTPDGKIGLSAENSTRIIVGPTNGFTSIDPGADISKDGRVVVFTGDRGNGPGLFAAYQGPAGWQIIRLAGEGLDGFDSFDPPGDVVVNNTWSSERGVTIAFKGHNATLGTGIYAVRLSFFGDNAAAANPIAATSVYASGVMPVALDGDTLGSGTIKDVELGQGINDVGRGQIAFWAQTSEGNQDIVLANPQQVVYINFNPSNTVVGQTQTNAALLKQVGITKFGWDTSSFSEALTDEGVTYSANTVQTDVVNLVQKMYSDAKAAVTVLGLPGQMQPAYVPEPVTDADGNVQTDASGNPITHGVYQTIYIGGDPLIDVREKTGNTLLGLASAPPTSAGGLDFYAQIPDSTAVVFVNGILQDGAYNGVSPASLPENQVVNGLATIIAHESGHNFGLFHLATANLAGDLDTSDIMINGTNPGEFVNPPSFSTADIKVYPYTDALVPVTESSAKRLDYSTGAPSGDLPNPLLIQASDPASVRSNIGFSAANSLNVQHLYVGVVSPFSDTPPTLQDLGSGDLATLLNNANLAVNAADQLIVLGSTNGTSIDIVGVAQGQEGAQNSLTMSVLGLTTDPRLQAPLTGTEAALHFYQLTSSGAVDLGLAPIQSTPVNHAPVLAPIRNQAVTFGSTVTFTASTTDPDAGQTLTYCLDPGAPIGATIDPNTGAFTWTPTDAQVGQVYYFNVRVTDNGTPALSDVQPVTINVLNRLAVLAVTEVTTPTPGPMQVAIDFNEALQPTQAQNVANYKIVSQGGISLPIQSAVYSDNGTQHRVVLTVATGTAVIPDVYHVYIDAGNLSATNGDQGAPKADQLWVDVTSENTLKPITVQPDGSFAVSGSSEFLGYGAPQYVVAGNFAGNGRTDLVVGTNGSLQETVNGNDVFVYDPLFLLKSNGDGTYAPPVPIAFGGQVKIQSLTVVDWNHDGVPDLLVGTANPPFDEFGDPSSYTYHVLLNDGHGNFTDAPETPIPVPFPDPSNTGTSPFSGTTSLYDLAGDGGNDIVYTVGNYANVIAKDPNLGYTLQMQFPLASSSDGLVYGGKVTFGDLNGDGKPDLIVSQYGYYADSPNFSVILSTPTGYATGQEIVGDYTSGLVDPKATGVGNFSGTGHNDIAEVYGGQIVIYQNDGKGNLTALAPIMLNSAYTVRAATFADLNHDGIPDLVVIEQPNNPNGSTTASGNGEPLAVWTFMADGHGRFNPTSQAPITLATTDESLPPSMTLADVDGDGNLDVILGSSQSGEVRLAINDGTGTMRPPVQPSPFVGTQTGGTEIGVSGQAFADFNNNGHMGFVTISPGGLNVYLGEADGTFKFIESLPDPFSSGNAISWVKVGELDNDGIPDIVCGDGSSMAVYLGNADGTFRQAPTFIDQASGYDIRNVTLADVNGDGNLDVVATLQAAYAGPYAFGVFFGDGKGNLTFNLNTVIPVQFGLSGNIIGDSHAEVAPVLGDFNGDGKLDLLVSTENTSNSTYTLTDYLGKGNGTFTPGPIVYSGAGSADDKILVGDLNGDGKLDLVAFTTASGGPAANVYLGDGHGGFSLASTVDLSMGSDDVGNTILPADIVLSDFNGDGKLDLAVSYDDFFANPSVVEVYPGDGTGHFGTAQSVTVGANPFTLISIPRAPFMDVGSFAVTDHGPTASNATTTAVAGSSVIIPVLDKASNPDKVPLTISQVSTPDHGTAHVTTDSSGTVIVYAANPGYNGTDSFTYTIQDPAGVQSTGTVTVTVSNTGSAPVITGNPSDQGTLTGQSATFTASASGNPTPTVQWQISIDGGNTFSDIIGATGTTLTLSNVTTDMDGNEYRAAFWNSFGTATTSAATLSVSPTPSAPVITGDPSSETVTAGQNATFTASASGVPTPTVHWQVSSDGGNTFTNISGATSTTLTLTNVTAAMNGNEYQAIFTNSAGSATTSAATLTISSTSSAPVITSEPNSLSVVAGQNATFLASASGNPMPTVQWQVSTDGGKTFTNLSGATNTTLTLTAVTTSMNGNKYQAIFTNSAGSATTTAATLTVSATDLAPVITTDPSSQSVPEGQYVTFLASATGYPLPTVQWQVSTDGGKTFSNISGATSTTLTLTGVTTAMNGYEYQAVFSNSAGSAISSAARLTVAATAVAPVITSNPSNLTVTAGQSATFTASASGSPTPTVQWQVSYDGGKTFGNLSGATGTTLTINNVPPFMNGYEYRAVFTNSAGAVISTASTLTVSLPTSPPPPPLPPSPPPSNTSPPPFQPPTLHTPPLLAFIDSILGAIETVIPYESETVTDSLFGFPLIVSTYDRSGNLVSVTLFGINVTFLFA